MKARGCIKTAAILFGTFILVIVVLADLGFLQGQLRLLHSIPYGDKAGHFILLGILTFLVVSSVLQSYPGWNPNRAVAGVALVLAVLSGIEEASQIFFPGRHAGIEDLMANYAGIFVFSLLAWQVNKKRTS